MKKNAAGFALSILSALVGVVGVIAYFVNAKTNSFANLGISPVVMACAVVGIAALVVRAALGKKDALWLDAMPVVSSVTLILAAVQLVGTRVNTIAAIMTFNNNANTMADLKSAIAAIAALLIAGVISIVSAYFDTSKD